MGQDIAGACGQLALVKVQSDSLVGSSTSNGNVNITSKESILIDNSNKSLPLLISSNHEDDGIIKTATMVVVRDVEDTVGGGWSSKNTKKSTILNIRTKRNQHPNKEEQSVPVNEDIPSRNIRVNTICYDLIKNIQLLRSNVVKSMKYFNSVMVGSLSSSSSFLSRLRNDPQYISRQVDNQIHEKEEEEGGVNSDSKERYLIAQYPTKATNLSIFVISTMFITNVLIGSTKYQMNNSSA